MFCKVVDNFGDIGVSWRLARQLADEHGVQVHLWVDDMALAQRFAGAGHPGVQLLHWQEATRFASAATVVIETFGCGLPPAYQACMQARRTHWVNVDYLSAEDWVTGFHGQPSPQANGLVRHYFYPGFHAQTGGLIRERDLVVMQEAAVAHAAAFWQSLGLIPDPQRLQLSLFCYPHAPMRALLQSFREAQRPVRVLVPESVAPALAAAMALPALPVGERLLWGQCELCVIPFLSQTDYDRLLHLCDLNFVRGEDSWIRAIWAGKPMIWLPYQQTEETHLQKLAAFLQCYTEGSPATFASMLDSTMQAWATGRWQAGQTQSLLTGLDTWKTHAQQFATRLSQQPDLATNLVIFIEKLRASRV